MRRIFQIAIWAAFAALFICGPVLADTYTSGGKDEKVATLTVLTESVHRDNVEAYFGTDKDFEWSYDSANAWLQLSDGTNDFLRVVDDGTTGTFKWFGDLEVSHAAIGVTPNDSYGMLLVNPTAAAAGAQQWSPPLVLQAQGWKTDATAASRKVEFMIDVRSVQGAANPTGYWGIYPSVNDVAYSATPAIAVGSGGYTGFNTETPTTRITAAGTIMNSGPAAVTSFAGTISSSGTSITFSSAADAILAGYSATNPVLGVTIIVAGAPAQTRYIASWTNSTTAVVSVAPSPAWSGDTITSTQFPILCDKKSDGTIAEVVLANGFRGIGTSGPSSVIEIIRSSNTGEMVRIVNTNNGGAAYSQLIAGEDALAKVGGIQYINSGWTPTGLVLPNSVSIYAAAGATSGLIIKTQANAPIIFGTNNTEKARVLGEGNFIIGDTTLTSTEKFKVEIDSATTAAPVPVALLSATSTGTPAAGFGPSLLFEAETAAGAPGNQEILGSIACVATTVTSTAEVGEIQFLTMTGGATRTEKVAITGLGNLTIGNPTENGNLVGGLIIKNGTAASAAVTDGIEIFAVDSSDSTSTLGLYLEQAVEDIGTFTPSHKFKILFNGVEYWLQLDAV